MMSMMNHPHPDLDDSHREDKPQPSKSRSLIPIWLELPPKPLPPPKLDPHFAELPAITRAVEALCYVILRIEWWLSPQGRLRNWLKINLLCAVWTGLPILLFVPLFGYLIRESSIMASQIHSLFNSLTFASLPLAFLAGIILLVLLILRR